MGVREDIKQERDRLAGALLPAYIAQLQALAADVEAGKPGLQARWQDLRTCESLAVSSSMARLHSFERALVVVERAEAAERAETALHEASLRRFDRDFSTYQPGWGQPLDRKRAAAGDRE